MRMIDVDELMERIVRTAADVCADYGDGFCQYGYSKPLLKILVRESITIDAVEVKHGMWVKCSENPWDGAYCSTCGRYFSASQWGG